MASLAVEWPAEKLHITCRVALYLEGPYPFLIEVLHRGGLSPPCNSTARGNREELCCLCGHLLGGTHLGALDQFLEQYSLQDPIQSPQMGHDRDENSSLARMAWNIAILVKLYKHFYDQKDHF